MTDAPLFTYRSRRSDPTTSHAAAAHVERTGQAAAQCVVVLDAVRRWPGRTACELAENIKAICRLKVDRYIVGRRLPELRELGAIRNGPARQCKATGRSALTWEVA